MMGATVLPGEGEDRRGRYSARRRCCDSAPYSLRLHLVVLGPLAGPGQPILAASGPEGAAQGELHRDPPVLVERARDRAQRLARLIWIEGRGEGQAMRGGDGAVRRLRAPGGALGEKVGGSGDTAKNRLGHDRQVLKPGVKGRAAVPELPFDCIRMLAECDE